MGLLQDQVTWYGINYTGTQNDAVGLSKQRKVGLDWYEFLCFESPTASFASQCNLFRTMWPDPAKGPLPWFSNYSTVFVFTGSLGVERYTDVFHTQVEASKEESEIRSISKKSETEIIFLSTIKIRRTAKLWFLKSVVQHWKWRVCESSRRHLQLYVGLRNI